MGIWILRGNKYEEIGPCEEEIKRVVEEGPYLDYSMGFVGTEGIGLEAFESEEKFHRFYLYGKDSNDKLGGVEQVLEEAQRYALSKWAEDVLIEGLHIGGRENFPRVSVLAKIITRTKNFPDVDKQKY